MSTRLLCDYFCNIEKVLQAYCEWVSIEEYRKENTDFFFSIRISNLIKLSNRNKPGELKFEIYRKKLVTESLSIQMMNQKLIESLWNMTIQSISRRLPPVRTLCQIPTVIERNKGAGGTALSQNNSIKPTFKPSKKNFHARNSSGLSADKRPRFQLS